VVTSAGLLTHVPSSRAQDATPVFQVVQTPNTQRVFDNDIFSASASSPSDIWAVGTTAIHYDGTAWTGYPLPGIVGELGHQMMGVAAISPTNAWAVGSFAASETTNGNILHWDGSAWSAVPNAAGGGDYLVSIAAISADDIWAGPCVLGPIEHYNGTEWTAVPSPPAQGPEYCVTGLSAISSNDVWAVGWQGDEGYNSRTLAEHWDGAQWAMVPSPSVGQGPNQLNGLVALGASDVWAVGFSMAKPPGSPLLPNETLIEHWNGTSWTVVSSPNVDYGGQPRDNELQGIVALSANDLWAFGWYAANPSGESGDEFTLVLHWDGASWSVVPSPDPISDPNLVNDPLYAGVVTGPGSVWLAGCEQMNPANFPDSPATSTLVLLHTTAQ